MRLRTDMGVEFADTERINVDGHGSTLSAVAAAISQQDEAGKAEWFPTYALRDGGVNVTVKTRITMPQWSEYDSACQAEKDEWDRFISALEAHEQGHVDLVKEHLSKIDEQMAGQSPDAAKRLWLNALSDLQSASDSYDAETDHGRNQGTIIDLSVVPPSSGV
jgi:Bacterial protein of unknown function (DUF922)